MKNSGKPEPSDEKAFNETLKRMLETPRKPHAKPVKPGRKGKPDKKDSRG